MDAEQKLSFDLHIDEERFRGGFEIGAAAHQTARTRPYDEGTAWNTRTSHCADRFLLDIQAIYVPRSSPQCQVLLSYSQLYVRAQRSLPLSEVALALPMRKVVYYFLNWEQPLAPRVAIVQ